MAEYDGSLKYDTKIDTDGFKKGSEEIKKEAKTRADNIKKSWNDVDKKVDESGKNAKDNISQVGSALKKLAATISIGALGKAMLNVGMEFESAFAGVKKTVNASKEELSIMRDELRAMSKEIPTSAADLSGIAEAAGQLGIETANITEFTRVMADLGVATNLTGEEAATTFARFANITGMPQTEFSRLGSTVVALGNNFATTESEISAMALRLAGAGKQAKLSEADTMGFAAALSSVGIEAEAGGSSFSRLMADMQLAVETGNDSLADFAKVSGMSAKDFAKAFKGDAAGAIVTFIKGLGESEKKGKSATAVLDEMGITEIRLKDALLRAAGASGVFEEAIALSNDEWSKNTALTKEAEQRYETLESKWQMLKNAVADLGITIYDSMRDPLADVADAARNAADGVAGFIADDGVEKIAAIAAPLTAAVLGYKAVAAAQTLATAAQTAFNAAQLANPAGLVVAGLAALTTAVVLYDKKVNGAARAIRNQREEYEETKKAITDGAEAEYLAAERAGILADELGTLVDANGKVKDGYENRVSYILGELSKATGTEYTLVDGVIQKYDELKTSIQDVLKAKQMSALAGGVQENFDNAANETEELFKKMTELRQQQREDLERYVSEHGQEMGEELYSVSAAYAETEQAYQEAAAAHRQATEDQMHYSEMLAAAEQGNTEEFLRLYREYDGAVKGRAATSLEAWEREKATLEERKTMFADLQRDAESAGQTAAAELYANEIKAIDKQLAEVNSNIENEMATMVTVAAQGGEAAGEAAGEAFVKNFDVGVANIGVGGSNGFETFLNSLFATWDIYEQKWKETIINKLTGVAETSGEESAKVGIAVNDNIGPGLDDAAVTASQKIGVIDTNIQSGLQTAATNAYTEATKIGANIDAGIAAGMNGKTSPIPKAASDMVDNAEKSAKKTAIVASPSKLFRDNVGKMISAGVAVGIDAGAPMVNKAAGKLMSGTLKYTKKIGGIHSPAVPYRDEVGKMISAGVAVGISGGAEMAYDEMDKLSAELLARGKKGTVKQEEIAERNIKNLKNSLEVGIITEEQYYSSLGQMRDRYFKAGSDEWERYTLDIIKYQRKKAEEAAKIAEEQKETLTGIYEDIVDEIHDKIQSLTDERDSFSDTLGELADGMKTTRFKGLFDDDREVVITTLSPEELRDANADKRAFADAAQQAKERIAAALGEENKALTTEIYKNIRSMGVVDGTVFADAINNADDKKFADWVSEMLTASKLDDEIAEQMYTDDMTELGYTMADGLYDSFSAELEEEFGELPDDFWDFGASAAQGFYAGFTDDLQQYINSAIGEINSKISAAIDGEITYNPSSSGSNTEYNITYNVQPSEGESTHAQLAAIDSAAKMNKLRGDY